MTQLKSGRWLQLQQAAEAKWVNTENLSKYKAASISGPRPGDPCRPGAGLPQSEWPPNYLCRDVVQLQARVQCSANNGMNQLERGVCACVSVCACVRVRACELVAMHARCLSLFICPRGTKRSDLWPTFHTSMAEEAENKDTHTECACMCVSVCVCVCVFTAVWLIWHLMHFTSFHHNVLYPWSAPK